jgi:GT2 family glycosyltransferase
MQSGQNLGFAGGVNCALRSMLRLDYDAFIILNNDTVLPPDLIRNFLNGAQGRALDLASPVIYRYPEQHMLWSQGNYYNAWTGTLGTGSIPGSIYYLPGCCLFVQRRVFERVGLFDEAFFMYGEDVEFCHRAARSGFRIGIVPEARMYHKTGAASVQNSFFYEFQINRGHLLLARKLFGSAPAQLSALCIKLPVLFLRACLRTVRFQNGNALQGYASAVADFMRT